MSVLVVIFWLLFVCVGSSYSCCMYRDIIYYGYWCVFNRVIYRVYVGYVYVGIYDCGREVVKLDDGW